MPKPDYPGEVRTPDELGPYLTTALICEKILREQDGVVSAIRIIDRVVRTGPGADEMEPFPYNLSILPSLKSGQARGVYQLSIQPIKPGTNEKPSAIVYPVNFEPPEDRGLASPQR